MRLRVSLILRKFEICFFRFPTANSSPENSKEPKKTP
jgi:hypothetical protein